MVKRRKRRGQGANFVCRHGLSGRQPGATELHSQDSEPGSHPEVPAGARYVSEWGRMQNINSYWLPVSTEWTKVDWRANPLHVGQPGPPHQYHFNKYFIEPLLDDSCSSTHQKCEQDNEDPCSSKAHTLYHGEISPSVSRSSEFSTKVGNLELCEIIPFLNTACNFLQNHCAGQIERCLWAEFGPQANFFQSLTYSYLFILKRLAPLRPSLG